MCRGSVQDDRDRTGSAAANLTEDDKPLVGELHPEDPAAAHTLDSEPVEGVADCLLQNDAARMTSWLRYGPPTPRGLSPEELQAIRVLLDETFDGDVTDDGYEHALGGVHALVWEGRELVGHGSVVMRRLLHGGRALRTGYVEGVAVRADRRRRGHGAAVMEALERVIRGAYEIGALGASDEAAGFYAGRGWQLWTGTASVIAPGGIERTEEEEDCIYVLPVSAQLTPDGDLACDWRGGDVW